MNSLPVFDWKSKKCGANWLDVSDFSFFFNKHYDGLTVYQVPKFRPQNFFRGVTSKKVGISKIFRKQMLFFFLPSHETWKCKFSYTTRWGNNPKRTVEKINHFFVHVSFGIVLELTILVRNIFISANCRQIILQQCCYDWKALSSQT